MLEFTTAAKATKPKQRDPEDAIPFAIKEEGEDGSIRVFNCQVYRPSQTQLALFLTAASRYSNNVDKVAAFVDFFMSIADEPTQKYIWGRLSDANDDFEFDPHLTSIVEGLVKEITARPTESPSGSAQSPQSGGQNSTLSTPALT